MIVNTTSVNAMSVSLDGTTCKTSPAAFADQILPVTKHGQLEGYTLKVGDRFNPYRLFYGAFIPEEICRYCGISPGAKLVYGRLYRYAGQKGHAFPAVATLAKECGLSPTQTKQYIKELERARLIEVDRDNRHYRPDGSGGSNYFFFLWHPVYTGETGSPRMMPPPPPRRDAVGVPHRDAAPPTPSGCRPLRESSSEESNQKGQGPAPAFVQTPPMACPATNDDEKPSAPPLPYTAPQETQASVKLPEPAPQETQTSVKPTEPASKPVASAQNPTHSQMEKSPTPPPIRYASAKEEIKAIYCAKTGEGQFPSALLMEHLELLLIRNNLTWEIFYEALLPHVPNTWRNPAGFLVYFAKNLRLQIQQVSPPREAPKPKCPTCGCNNRRGALPDGHGLFIACPDCSDPEWRAQLQQVIEEHLSRRARARTATAS